MHNLPLLEQEIEFWQHYIHYRHMRHSGPVPARAWAALATARFRMYDCQVQGTAGQTQTRAEAVLH